MPSAWDQPAPELNGEIRRSDLLGWSLEECVDWMKGLGQPAYRGDQLFQGVLSWLAQRILETELNSRIAS